MLGVLTLSSVGCRHCLVVSHKRQCEAAAHQELYRLTLTLKHAASSKVFRYCTVQPMWLQDT